MHPPHTVKHKTFRQKVPSLIHYELFSPLSTKSNLLPNYVTEAGTLRTGYSRFEFQNMDTTMLTISLLCAERRTDSGRGEWDDWSLNAVMHTKSTVMILFVFVVCTFCNRALPKLNEPNDRNY